MNRLVLTVLWLLHFLPLPALRALGAVLGCLAYFVARKRRTIAHVNLTLCFPNMNSALRNRLILRHFIALVQAALDRIYLRWSSLTRVKKMVRVIGADPLPWEGNEPVLLLSLHLVGLEFAAVGLAKCSTRHFAVIYSQQRIGIFDEFLRNMRSRFPGSLLIARGEGVRKGIVAIKKGYVLAYLPDQDFGPENSIFVPFFGVPAATITGLARIAKITGAKIIPNIVRMVPEGYEVEYLPPLADFPSDDIVRDTRRLNAFIEETIPPILEQYNWVHRRFKTRPPGEPSFYKK